MAAPAAVLSLLVTANTAPANAALAKTDAQLKKTAATGTSAGATMAKGLGGVAIAAGATATALFKIGEEFDSASDKIRTQTGSTGRDLKKLESSFKNVVKSVPTDFDSAADAVAGLNQRLDLSGKPLERMSKQVIQLSRVTGTDVQGNVRSVSRLFGDWSVKTDRQTKTLDGLYRVAQETGVTVADLADTMVQFGSPLRTLGLDFDQTAAMIAKFEKEGVNISTLMSGLRLSVANLSAPTDDLRKKFNQLGIDAKQPADQILQVMEAIDKLDTRAGNTLAMEVFGRRAGSDMAAAVREGRFELDKLMDTFNRGEETINRSEKATRDLTEHWTVFKNRAMVALEPVATRVFKLVGEGMKALSKLNLNGAIRSLKEFWQEADVVRAVFKRVVEFTKNSMGTFMSLVKDAVKFVSSILRGDFKAAWDAVANIFKTGVRVATAPIRGMISIAKTIAGKIGDGLESVFGGAWDRIKSIFEGGVNAAIDFLNLIIGALNKIPGVDIGEIGHVGGGRESGAGRTVNAEQHFRGGKVNAPMAIVGEEAPTHPEFVLATNPAYRNRNLGLWEQAGKALGVPGFAKGGVVPTNTAGAVLDSAKSIIGKFPSTDSLPGWLKDTGSYALKKAAQFAREKVANIAEAAANAVTSGMTRNLNAGTYPGVVGDTDFLPELGRRLSKMAQSTRRAISVQSGGRTLAEQAALYAAYQAGTGNLAAPPNPNAPHVRGVAADITPGREVFGSVAGKYGLGFTVASEPWHIELARMGGILGKSVLEYFAKGGVRGKGTGAGEPLGRAIPAALQKYNHTYSKHVGIGGQQMPADKIAMLAEFFGMPGITMQQIARGESNYEPGAVGDDAAAGYGNTFGYGLWQITTGQGHDPYVNRLGGWNEMLNPVKNAVVAAKLYKAAGVQPWYGTRYMTGTNLHWNGDFGNTVKAGGGGGGGSSSNNGGRGGRDAGPSDPVVPSGYDPYNPPLPSGYEKPPVAKHIQQMFDAYGGAIKLLDEKLMLAEFMHSFASSENGSDLGPLEAAEQLFLNQQLLTNLEGMAQWLKKAIGHRKTLKKALPGLNERLGELVGNSEGVGRILETKHRIDELTNTNFSSDTSQLDAERVALLTAMLQEANLRTAVSQAQYRVLANTPYMGAFANGGVALVGERGPELAYLPSGTRIRSNEETQQMLTPTVVVNGDIVQAPGDTRPPIEVQGARAIVQQGSRGIARRPLTSARGY